MISTGSLDDLAARIGKVLESSPAKDIERNVRALLQAGLSRLDVVPRQEFDTQARVLLRTRELVEALEARVSDLEGRLADGTTARSMAGAPAGSVGSSSGADAAVSPQTTAAPDSTPRS